MPDMESLMTINQVAHRFNVTSQAIRNWIADGKLKPCKVPGDVRFNPEYIESLTLADLNSNEYTPYRCRKLEREVDELKEQIKLYRQSFTQLGIVINETNLKIMKEE